MNLYSYETEKARALLREAGYPDGFEMKITTYEAWKLEAQILCKMLERVGLKASLEILTWNGLLRRIYQPLLPGRPEEQDWDMALVYLTDWSGHTAVSPLAFCFLEDSDFRWIEYDAAYESLWNEMVMTVDRQAQEEKIRQMVKYIYDRAYALFIYSPLTLYAVNKEVNFVTYRDGWLHLKETSVTDRHWSIRDKKN